MLNRNVLRVVLADNHSLIRHGIKKLIEKNSELEVVGEVGNGEELLRFLESHTADLIVLDISMPGIGGTEAAATIKRRYPWIKILMLTIHTSQQVFYNAMIAGADGYLLKDDSDEELLVAIERVKRGKNYISPSLADDFTDDLIEMYRNGKKSPFRELTKREREILQLVVNGFTSKKMAEHLGLSPRTVDHHRSNLLRKLNKRNSADLVNYAVRNGYIST